MYIDRIFPFTLPESESIGLPQVKLQRNSKTVDQVCNETKTVSMLAEQGKAKALLKAFQCV